MTSIGGNRMSHLVDFYRSLKADTEGRLLIDILAWHDDDLRRSTTFIQWLFHIPEPSQVQSRCPSSNQRHIGEFKSDPILQANLMRSFELRLVFPGSGVAPRKERLLRGRTSWPGFQTTWASPNHNRLRITRILRSLMLLGMGKAQAQALYEWLEAVTAARRFPIPAGYVPVLDGCCGAVGMVFVVKADFSCNFRSYRIRLSERYCFNSPGGLPSEDLLCS